MALRVLLADESTSIKKVMLLALQDFGVEVKAVPVGVDVLPVCRTWHPDIVFVDVLLSKRSGYEVSAELKADADLKKIPVVIMWSGFMDIDEAKAKASGAERRLEKPFDGEALRTIVRDLVPAVKDNLISNFISFPKLPDFVETRPAAELPKKASVTAAPELDEPEAFTEVPLPKTAVATKPAGKPRLPETDQWHSDNLDRFKIQLPQDDFAMDDLNLQNLEDASIELAGGGGEIHLSDLDSDVARPSKPLRESASAAKNPSAGLSATFGTASAGSALASIDPAVAEQILRDQVRTVLQDIAWKILPDLAERIVKEEIKKLLKEAEKLS